MGFSLNAQISSVVLSKRVLGYSSLSVPPGGWHLYIFINTYFEKVPCLCVYSPALVSLLTIGLGCKRLPRRQCVAVLGWCAPSSPGFGASQPWSNRAVLPKLLDHLALEIQLAKYEFILYFWPLCPAHEPPLQELLK